MRYQTDDLRIKDIREVIPPVQLHEALPITEAASETVHATRQEVQRILQGEDDRLIAIVGPCSIHDPRRPGTTPRASAPCARSCVTSCW
jgi:3-deoxy-7-phosphoheptulonate synthase